MRRGVYVEEFILASMERERSRAGSMVGRRAVLGAVSAMALTGLAGCFANDDGGAPTTEGNTVVVGPDGQYVYEPAELTVAPGESVTWSWASANHNVVPSSQPDDANWSGTEGGASETYDDGYTYEYTFETPGTYEYYCSPHEGLGMIGTVVVDE
jgi:plastocyanin